MKIKEKMIYFMKGMGSVINMFPTQKKLGDYFPHYNAKTPQEQDTMALTNDWATIGKDLENVIKKFGEQI